MDHREARNSLANSIESYLDGEIDNDELFKILWSQSVCQENTCREIVWKMDLYLSEFDSHRNEGKYRIGDKGAQAVRRWIALLRSDWEWPAERSDTTPHNTREAIWSCLRRLVSVNWVRAPLSCYWPFASEEEWISLLKHRCGKANSEMPDN